MISILLYDIDSLGTIANQFLQPKNAGLVVKTLFGVGASAWCNLVG